jgi:hypothetical protein
MRITMTQITSTQITSTSTMSIEGRPRTGRL